MPGAITNMASKSRASCRRTYRLADDVFSELHAIQQSEITSLHVLNCILLAMNLTSELDFEGRQNLDRTHVSAHRLRVEML